MNKKVIIQTCICVFTVLSIFCVNVPALVVYAPWIGLAAQPFWFYESWSNKQWGVFLTAIAITVSWVLGLIL